MNKTEVRKDQHITINLEQNVNSALTTGLEDYVFNHQALPEIDLQQVNTETTFLGKNLKIPLLISSMTGGTDRGDRINCALAEAAQVSGIAMGVGSQRLQLEKGEKKPKGLLRKIAPFIPLYANIGAIQLKNGYGVDECQRAVDMIEADGLILHLNPLQEALQPEGQTNFSGLVRKIEEVCRVIEVPVIVKEVGWGINLETAKKLIQCGVSAIDVAGAGGTSWSEVEKHRSVADQHYRIASKFRDWGIPTAECINEIRLGLPKFPLIASGGLRGGLELAKAIALGANIGGIAGPFLSAANRSVESVLTLIQEIELELRITMFAAGVVDIQSLANTPLVRKSK